MELLIRSLPLVKKETNDYAGLAHGEEQSEIKKSAQKKILANVKIKLDAYLKNNLSIQGFILDFSSSIAGKKSNLYKVVSGQIASFGAALRLPSMRTLVLLPGNFDAALAAHRICKNSNCSTLLFFEADNSGDILKLVEKY
jgi:hypothetical protein